MIKELGSLVHSAVKITDGNMNSPVAIQRNDEIGTLQSSFEEMRCALKDHIENLDLKVQERTRELVAAQKERKDILDSIEQGIFTMNLDLSLNRGHSLKAETYFHTHEFNGKSIKELHNCLQAKAISQ